MLSVADIIRWLVLSCFLLFLDLIITLFFLFANFFYVYVANSRRNSSSCLSLFLVYSHVLSLFINSSSWQKSPPPHTSPLTISHLDLLPPSIWGPLSFRHLWILVKYVEDEKDNKETLYFHCLYVCSIVSCF